MMKLVDCDLAVLDLDALEAVQRSAGRAHAEIEPYLGRTQKTEIFVR